MNLDKAPADARLAAELLMDARRNGAPLLALPSSCAPRSPADAYRIQDIVGGALGPVGAWKVGSKGPGQEPTCASIAAHQLFPSGCVVSPAACRLRGVEAEIAVRLGQDLPPRALPWRPEEVATAIATVMPVLEVVDSRFERMSDQPPLSLLADSASNAGLVLGPEQAGALPMDPSGVQARLLFDGHRVAGSQGGHAVGDLLALLTWLANHVANRAGGLRAGQVVTTGTWTGLLFAPPAASVQGWIGGFGNVALSFG